MSKVVIIGNGISGITAARHVRKNSDHEILVISAETEYFYSRTALMYIYMGHMRFQDTQPYEPYFWKKNRIDLLQDWVESIDTENKILQLKNNAEVSYDHLILALGSKPNKFGWPGQDLEGVQGLYSKQDLDQLEKNTPGTKRMVIVGGGLIGVELAEMALSRNIDVTFLVREDYFWSGVLPKEEGVLITKHIQSHHVDLRLNTELKEILGDENGRCNAVMTSSGEKIECEIVGLTAGVSPNIDFLKNTGIACERGVLVNNFMETNAPDVYAVGDCVQFEDPVNGRRAFEQVWYTGRIMGESVAQTVCGNRTKYQPGHWFNSAKFFDIEYQTYGSVGNKAAENEGRFYWEKKNMAVHLVWDKNTHEFIGVNTFGIRMRHDLFDLWLGKKASIQEVVSQLRTANFDPELYRHYEPEIVEAFNQQTGMNVQLKKKTWWRNLLHA